MDLIGNNIFIENVPISAVDVSIHLRLLILTTLHFNHTVLELQLDF